MKIRMLVPVLSILLLVSCTTPGATQTTKPTEKTPVATQKVTTPTNANGYALYRPINTNKPDLVTIHLLDVLPVGTESVEIVFEFINKTNGAFYVSIDNFHINNYTVEAHMITDVNANMKAIDSVIISNIPKGTITGWGARFTIKSSLTHKVLMQSSFSLGN